MTDDDDFRREHGGNVGHGHVYPRPDKVRVRCGGPALCATCKRDFDQKAAEMNGPSTSETKANDPHVKAYLTVAMNDTFDSDNHHYAATIECTCGWTGKIANNFPRSMILDRDVYLDALMKGVTDGLELALIVHREGKIG